MSAATQRHVRLAFWALPAPVLALVLASFCAAMVHAGTGLAGLTGATFAGVLWLFGRTARRFGREYLVAFVAGGVGTVAAALSCVAWVLMTGNFQLG